MDELITNNVILTVLLNIVITMQYSGVDSNPVPKCYGTMIPFYEHCSFMTDQGIIDLSSMDTTFGPKYVYQNIVFMCNIIPLSFDQLYS